MQTKPIPQEVRELFDYLMRYAATGNLGVISTLDKATGQTRFALMGRHETRDGYQLVPLGFLSTTVGDEVYPPGFEPPVEFVALPERYEEFLVAQQVELDRWADDGGPPDA
jgi:hypothetical protein